MEFATAGVSVVAAMICLLAGFLAYRLWAVDGRPSVSLERQAVVFRTVVWHTTKQHEPLLQYPWLPKPAAYRWSFAVSLLVAVCYLIWPAQEFGILKWLLAPFYGLAGFSLSVCLLRWRFDTWAERHAAEVERMVWFSPRAVEMLRRREQRKVELEQERWI